jgi:hypothetical protein
MSEANAMSHAAAPQAKGPGLEAEFRSSITDMGEIIHGLGLAEQVCPSCLEIQVERVGERLE